MSYLGGYLGGGGTTTTTTTTPDPVFTVTSPFVPSEPEYVDHVLAAINRLCEQFRGDHG